jgi:hypothetical protein
MNAAFGESLLNESPCSSSSGPNDRECDEQADTLMLPKEMTYLAVVLQSPNYMQATTGNSEHAEHDTERE